MCAKCKESGKSIGLAEKIWEVGEIERHRRFLHCARNPWTKGRWAVVEPNLGAGGRSTGRVKGSSGEEGHGSTQIQVVRQPFEKFQVVQTIDLHSISHRSSFPLGGTIWI
jgi:hypothetical protein